MSVEEYNLKYLIVDSKRVVVLYQDYPPYELDETTGEALASVVTKITRRFRKAPKQNPVLRPVADDGYEAAKQANSELLSQPERLAEVTPEARKCYEAEDVIVPAVERVHHMPKGIKRHTMGRNHYADGTPGRAVLRTVAEFARPVLFNEVRDRIWQQPVPAGKRPMPQGTVSSQLHQLADAGYLRKEKNVTKHALIYTLTDKGEEILTTPPRQENLL